MWAETEATEDGGRHAGENQQRRHEETAAHAEHPGDEPDRQSHGEDGENSRRHLGDRQIDGHAANVRRAGGKCSSYRGSLLDLKAESQRKQAIPAAKTYVIRSV